jgi:hypothetical protein
MSTHWSQLISDDNPRGYNEKQMQKIADADTLYKKQAVELHVMNGRRDSELRMKERVDDEYGIDRINAMISDIKAEYATMGVGITRAIGAFGTEGDEEAEEEESDSGNEPRQSKR